MLSRYHHRIFPLNDKMLIDLMSKFFTYFMSINIPYLRNQASKSPSNIRSTIGTASVQYDNLPVSFLKRPEGSHEFWERLCFIARDYNGTPERFIHSFILLFILDQLYHGIKKFNIAPIAAALSVSVSVPSAVHFKPLAYVHVPVVV